MTSLSAGAASQWDTYDKQVFVEYFISTLDGCLEVAGDAGTDCTLCAIFSPAPISATIRGALFAFGADGSSLIFSGRRLSSS